MEDLDISKLVTNSSAAHELKILSCYFDAVASGIKTFEIRKNSDRGFQKGDVIKLVETEQTRWGPRETGNSINAVITYVTNYEQKDDYVVFSFVTMPSEKR